MESAYRPALPPGKRRRGNGSTKAPRTARVAGPPTPRQQILAIHRRADEDRDGFLNQREFGRIHKVLGHEALNWQRAGSGIHWDNLAKLTRGPCP